MTTHTPRMRVESASYDLAPCRHRVLFYKRPNRLSRDRFLNSIPRPVELWQLSDSQFFEFNRCSFRLQTQVAGSRLAVVAARDLFAVYPQPDLAVDAADIVVV